MVFHLLVHMPRPEKVGVQGVAKKAAAAAWRCAAAAAASAGAGGRDVGGVVHGR